MHNDIIKVNKAKNENKSICKCFIVYLFLLSIQFIHSLVLAFPSVFYLSIFLSAFAYAYYVLAKKFNANTTLLILMIFSSPFSFHNIWGTYGPMSYFLILNVFFILKNMLMLKFKSKGLLFLLVVISLFSIIPLVISAHIGSAINTFIKYELLFLTLICALGRSDSLNLGNWECVKKAIILMSIGLSLIMAVQIVLAYIFNLDTLVLVLGGNRKVVSLWFNDFSSNGLYFVLGLVLVFLKRNKKLSDYFIILFCLGILALTSTRTALFAGFVVFFLIVIFSPGIKNRLGKITGVVFISFIGLIVLSINRGRMFDFAELFSDTGRVNLIFASLRYAKENLFFGSGFEWTPIVADYGMIVHVHFLLLLNMAGVFYLSLYLILIFYILGQSLKKKNYDQFWLMTYILIVGLFIPDLSGNLIMITVFASSIMLKPSQNLQNSSLPILSARNISLLQTNCGGRI